MTPRVETTGGTVEGRESGGHQEFLGIPFAQPPVGARRFLAPQPAKPWTGVRPARAFGPAAPQGKSQLRLMEVGDQDEDCLYLNVYTPAADGGQRPVLVWIHGGGFTAGSGAQSLYDGGPLVERGDLVVVTINYRLGALGYAYLGARGGREWGAAANARQLDQVAALEWVRDNAAAFGGDPGNVTIAGESAGGFAVATLLAMPAGRGLFQRAIAQSGTAYRVADRERADRLAGALMDELGVDDARKLQEIPARAFIPAQLKAVQKVGAGALAPGFAPVHDGESLPRRPLEATREGWAADIPLIVGTNRDESGLWRRPGAVEPIDAATLERRVKAVLGRHAERAPELIEAYRSSREALGLPAESLDLVDAITTDLRFRMPAHRLVEAQLPHQPHTYLYLFCHEAPRIGRAVHGLELPFVFGTHTRPDVESFSGTGPEADRLAADMMDAWIAFARSGDPSTADVPWPAFDAERRPTLIFDRERSAAADRPLDAERAALEPIVR